MAFIKIQGKEDLPYCDQCADEDIAASKNADLTAIENEHKEIIEKRFSDRYRNLEMGRRFESATFENYTADSVPAAGVKKWCQRYAGTFPDRLTNGDSLILCGKPGTGKNHLAAAICKAVIDLKRTAVHTTAIRLVRRVKESWSKSSEVTEQEAINLFLVPDLLVIDEVGVQFGSQAEQVILMEVINSRYSDMRPTILISNLEVADLEKFIGPQIVDRFYEGNSGVLFFGWDSHRRAKA